MSTLFEMSGGAPQRQPKYVPIFMDSTFTGLFTQRSALHDPSDYWTKKYGGRPDALWQGKNIELTNNLTLKRRPGLSQFGSSPVNYPTPPLRAFSFQLADGTIQVIVDTGSSGALVLTSVANASAGSTVYTGTITGGGTNAFAGLNFTIAGFVNGANNGTFLCTASTATTLTLSNTIGVAETHAATATSPGAVFVDNQNGTITQLFAKSAGAGQSSFVAVAGVLYIGDGVDIKKYTPLNTNGKIWNWGVTAPATQPTVTSVASGSAAVTWQASTVYSTMGLTVDSFNQVWQLIGVNADGSNSANAVYGTAGTGSPSWNPQTLYGQTTEGAGTPIVWQNLGPIQPWAANTQYGDAGVNGTAAPVAIYDLASSSIYLQFNNNGGLGRSGTVKPQFNGVPNPNGIWDNQCHWFFLCNFSSAQPWKASTSYAKWYSGGGVAGNHANTNCVIEPFILPPPPTQSIYLQVPTNTGTSGASYLPFLNNSPASTIIYDKQLSWLSLGSGTWTASTNYIGWQAQGTTFSCVFDGVNLQVCTVGGLSDVNIPGKVLSQTFTVSNASGGNTTITGTFSPVLTTGRPVVLSGFANAANNGNFQIISCNATTLVINNASGVAETTAATITYNPWGVAYGSTIQDGTVTWVSVGPPVTWVASTIWHLPLSGWQPPQASQAFGGSTINSNTSLVETVISSGKSGSVQPTWGAVKTNIADGGTALTLTQVTVSGTNGQITTYTGTITGGAANALAGKAFMIAGFTNAVNNGLIYVTASTATTLVCVTTAQINETHAGTATPGLVWFAQSAASSNSLVWTKGYVYAYSFKARSLTDFYSPAPLGGAVTPPGSAFGALGAPTGSGTNVISTASPVFTIVGGNAGAINTITGLGSTDLQVDTIVIWRSADGGSSATMFELTEIPAPKPINGAAQPWTFQDFLPDTPTSKYPGLNILSPAPINSTNNPPPTAFLPMVYNYQRIWGANGQSVPFSGGPDVLTGNPNEAFNPSNALPFLAPVIRLVKSTQGIFTFLTDSIEIIGGGPQTASFFSVTIAPGIGLLSYNALDVYGGEIYFLGADNQFRTMTPSLNIANAGFALGDQFFNQPSSGVSDATWNANNVYVAVHQNGVDNCIMVADGSTGWYRLNPHQVPGVSQGPEPIWSPFALITNGCKLVQSVQTSPGIKKLLVGGTTNGQPLLFRDLTVFTDNGVQYDAQFTMGSIVLAHPGQLAVLDFLEFDFSGVAYKPTVSYLLNEITGTFTAFSSSTPQFDPPSIYGATISPTSYSPNRYYFKANNSLARCRHLQIKVDFGTTAVGNEMYAMTIFGRLMVET